MCNVCEVSHVGLWLLTETGPRYVRNTLLSMGKLEYAIRKIIMADALMPEQIQPILLGEP